MYVLRLYKEYIKGVDAFIDFTKKDMLDNIRGRSLPVLKITMM
jgi:hypothetical protein